MLHNGRNTNKQRIIRSLGGNRSERILAALCDRAFLPLWCYPNPYRLKGKELCDLIVVFGNDIIIFSDKDCAFPATGNLSLDWSRWKRRSVNDSVRQLIRAADWIESRPSEVFLDAKCQIKLPVKINYGAKIHCINVVRNVKKACTKYFGNGSGSLVCFAGEETNTTPPFCIHVVQRGRVMHVFDELTLPILLGQLDTAADFIGYLEAKEKAFLDGTISSSSGEEETLAIYLSSSVDGRTQRIFPLAPEGCSLAIAEGHWDTIQSTETFKQVEKEKKISYLWDDILASFGRLVHSNEAPNPQNLSLVELEQMGRFLANEDRFSRTLLSRAIVQKHMQTTDNEIFVRRVRSPHFSDDIEYAFVFTPKKTFPSDEEYRSDRRAHLVGYTLHVSELTRSKSVVGIATEGGHSEEGSSWDFCICHKHELTPEEVSIIEEARAEYGWLSDT